MKVLITGSTGQLGYAIINVTKRTNFDVFAPGRNELDITNQEQTADYIKKIHPDVIIHSAAYTNVEQAEANHEEAYRVNVNGTRNIAVAANEVGARLCYISTDFVFDGSAAQAYKEFDTPHPINVYGETKWMGEECVRDFCRKWYIVRTSWLFGKNGKNFVSTMLKLAETHETLKVVGDETGSPTYAADLACFISHLIQTEKYGIYHVSNSGQCTRYEFAKAIFEVAGIDIQIEPIVSSQFPSKAERPKNSVLANHALNMNGFTPLRPWKEALQCYLKDK